MVYGINAYRPSGKYVTCALVVAALAAGAASWGAASPAHVFEEYAPSVTYDPDQGRLDIAFAESVDPPSIDADRMHLGCDGCTDIPLSGHAVIHDAFGSLYHMEISGDIQARLLAASNPVVKFQPGSYRSAADGSVHGYKEAPVIRPQDAVARMLERAEYVIHANEIVLHFGAAVDMSSMDWSRIYLPGCCGGPQDGTAAAGLDLAWTGGDGRSAAFSLTPQARDGLLYTRIPSLGMDAGAYRSDNGTMNDREFVYVDRPGVPDWWDPDRWSGGGPRTFLLAEYFPDSNRLYLHFAGEVNPFTITTPRMYVWPPWDPVITLSASEFAGVVGGGRSIAFELSPSSQYDLSLAGDHLEVHIKAGAVRMAADGADAGDRGAPLTIHGEFFPPDPAVPPGSPVSRVDYDRDTRELVVFFREAIDPASVNASRIALSGHRGCAVALEDGDLAGIGADGRSATFTVDRNRNGFLRSMSHPQMDFDGGAFAAAADGTGNGAVSVPLPEDPHPHSGHKRWSFSGLALVGDTPCRTTYSVESPSNELRSLGYGPAAVARHTETIMSAVRDGLNSWSAINPQFFFEMATDGTADIAVTWLDYDGTKLGGSAPCLLSCNLGVVLIGPDYRGGDIGLRSYSEIKWTTAHEFGHNLWLEHHISPNHLMAGSGHNDPILMDPFDDLGYNIPVR